MKLGNRKRVVWVGFIKHKKYLEKVYDDCTKIEIIIGWNLVFDSHTVRDNIDCLMSLKHTIKVSNVMHASTKHETCNYFVAKD